MDNISFELGKVLLIEKLPREKTKSNCHKLGYTYKHRAKYKCFCGNEFVTLIVLVNNNITKSCGCYKKYKHHLSHHKHGDSKNRLYNIFHKMKDRCLKNNNPYYEFYGGRGITICDEWLHYEPFKEWAMANGYTDTLTIDRINNDGNYCPENCRWVTYKIQSINKRVPKNKMGVTGVRPTPSGTYKARITINGEQFWLGTYKTIEEAGDAYKKAKISRDDLYHYEGGSG